ncbi:EG45-like domain containing protein [Gossypium hirsutum]|uniref:EG45-like domain containing protein n=1 Tax=Gossypium hirsutum TaxID=3635 RepID=A0A1U8K0N2_GOSHI|nr:EG45-like domain containing protein [Gossypium hirsutum]
MRKLSILFCIALAFILTFSSWEVVADTGTATFYTPPYVPSACNGYQNDRVMIAAASDAFWAGGSACGRNYKVECRGATNQGDPNPCRGQDYMVVKIVYYCPSGCQGTIDLSQEAFAAIANPDADKTEISFHQYVDHLLMLLSAVALVSNCML